MSIYKENQIDLPRRNLGNLGQWRGSTGGLVSLRSRKHAKNKTHSKPQPPQYEDMTQESDLESVTSSSASQSKRKRKFSWILEQEEDLFHGYISSY